MEATCSLCSRRRRKETSAEGLGYHAGDAFGFDFEDGVSFKFARAHVVAREEIVLGFVFAELEHGGVLEFGGLCHKKKVVMSVCARGVPGARRGFAACG